MKTRLLILGVLASALAVGPAFAQGTPNATGSQSGGSAPAQAAKPQPQPGAATTGQGMNQAPAAPSQQPNNNETGSQSSGSAPAQSSSPK